MRDVAIHAGVSTATVSRALSGGRAMTEDLRSRVLKSADELGYRVNLLGRALRKQRLNVVGLIVPDLANPFFASLAEHLGKALRAEGFDLLISSAGGSTEDERRAVESFLGQQIHALVIIPSDETDSEPALSLAAGRIPVVQFDRMVAASEVPFVGCDNARGIELVTEHLASWSYGHEPVVFVGAAVTSSSARERREAFLVRRPRALALDGSFDVEWGHRAARELHDRGMRRGVVVAAADVIALGVLSELQALGHRVPEDFRVIGFDGVGVTGYAYPALTTIRQPVEEMNSVILDLVSGVRNVVPGERIRVPPSIVEAASSPGVQLSV